MSNKQTNVSNKQTNKQYLFDLVVPRLLRAIADRDRDDFDELRRWSSGGENVFYDSTAHIQKSFEWRRFRKISWLCSF